MREPATLRSQLSVQVPLLALGCINPWLYHKLTLTCCYGETLSFYILRESKQPNGCFSLR